MLPGPVTRREGASPKLRESSSPKTKPMRPERGLVERQSSGLSRSSGSQTAFRPSLPVPSSGMRTLSDGDLVAMARLRRPASEVDLRLSSKAQEDKSPKELRVRSPKGGRDASPRSARSKAKFFPNDISRVKTGAEVDDFSLASTSASSNTASPNAGPSAPQATSLLLKAMQRQCRTEEEGRGSRPGSRPPSGSRHGSYGQDLSLAMARPPSHGQDLCLALAQPPSYGSEETGHALFAPPAPVSRSCDAVDSARAWSKSTADPDAMKLSSRRKEGDATGLLARRRMRLPELQPLSRDIPKDQVTARIRHLDKNEKIFDLYYWNEVIQETGCGGKVVICSPKVPGQRSPLLGPPESPFGGSYDKSGSSGSPKGSPKLPKVSGSHVMKMKAKAELRSCCCEEQFRKAHLKMLNLPPHLGILPLYEVLEDDNFYYVVMEKANGGSLLTSLVEEFPDGIMPEKAVKRLIKEILSAIEHLHNQGMLHRDIKVDNLVVHVDDEVTSPCGRMRSVKLIDFDIADPDWIPHSPGKKHRDWVGTMANSAPETFQGFFSQASDLYSIGTVLYLLMSGRGPYADDLFDLGDFDDMEVVSERLANADISWCGSCWSEHPACRDFCMWLLSFDPLARPKNAEVAAQHPWFTLGRHK